MAKSLPFVIAGVEIGAGIALHEFGGVWLAKHGISSLAGALIESGVGTALVGVGTLLAKGPKDGFATTTRNSVAPWKVSYGRARGAGTLLMLDVAEGAWL